LLEYQQREEEKKQRQLEEVKVQGQIKFNEYLQASILKTPEWIRPYLNLEFQEVDYVRIGGGWDRVENISLYFSIPGLANIQFDPIRGQWRTERAGWKKQYNDAQPYLHFGNNSYWESDVEFVLRTAQGEMREYLGYVAEHAAEQEERARRAEAELRLDEQWKTQRAEEDLRNELKRQQEQSEEQALFDAIKDDAIAIYMLKAFVLLRDERSTFEQRLSEADETMYSIEERWSRKAADLRRQADDAQRRADDEKARIQSDLEDAEAKLKKTQRGW
jgi:hypothetical protein